MKKIIVIDEQGPVFRAVERAGVCQRVLWAKSASAGLEASGKEPQEIIVLDMEITGMGGLEVLQRLKAANAGACVIAAAAIHDMQTTVEAIKKGAFDCISKPVDEKELALSLKKAFRGMALHSRLRDLSPQDSLDYRAGAIIGRTRVMEEIFKTIGIASQSKVTILVQGESGTGKELIARAIHCNSAEKDRPFVAINCSALVETLLETELFGHEKGAFTGALFKKEGKFEAAGGGTVFLDEIGEMSQALQVKLLRVLQERSFERVGGSETIKTDVRVIAATNRELKELVSRGAFREDLYYRLKVITIDVPPLRKRAEDIPLLVAYLLEKAGRELHKKVGKVPERVMELMMGYSWPGNVRELENVITRGVLLSKSDVLSDVYLPAEGLRESKEDGGRWRPSTLNEAEREHISKALEYAGWNKSRAARLLGITLPRIDRKIKKYGLYRRE